MVFPNMTTLKMNQFFTAAKIDFKRVWKVFMPISAALVVASIAIFCVKGSSMLGVDFTGGTQVMFDYVKQVPATEMEKALASINYKAVVTYKSSASAQDSQKVEILIRDDMTQKSSNPKEVLQKYLNERFPEAQFTGGQESSVGGLIGWEFSKYAIIAIILSTLGIGVYVTLRYELSYAAASIFALLHDVIIVMGIYILSGRTISLSVVAAILTTLGYSINDKVVVFDRVRENVGKDPKADFMTTVIGSVNQTLSRTVLTSLTTLIVVVVLFIWGGIAINDFVFIMLLGIIVGTYSSMCVAAPTVVWLRSRGKHHAAALPADEEKK
jgi:SecD/SecF fusion protein